MKNTKKILVCLLISCLIFSYSNISVFADTSTTGDLLTTNENNMIISNGVLKHYSGEDTEVVVPEGVVTIGTMAFYASNVTKVTLPSTVKYIDGSAFGECYNLESINLPEGLISIGDRAFRRSYKLDNIVFPSTLTSIGSEAFSGNSHLTSLVIPDNVTSIGEGCFSNTNLKEVTLPNNLTTLDIGTFSSSKLTKITIPDSVTTIKRSAFAGCEYLEEVTLPKSITAIDDSTFSGCKKLSSINLNKNIKSIGKNAFEYCSSLKSVDLYEGLESIGGYAFKNSGIKKIYIPSTITTIEPYTFQGCSLEVVENGENIVEIKDHAFANSAKFSQINISDKVKYIGAYAFHCCGSLDNITLPEGLKTIGSNAFSHCDSLSSINIPSTVTDIGSYTFSDCKSLVDVKIEEGIKTMSYAMFNCCSSIPKIKIPDSVTTIREDAFLYCSSLKDVDFSNNLDTIEESAFFSTPISKLELPDTLKVIGKRAFYSCRHLGNVILPKNIVSIGTDAFSSVDGIILNTYKNTSTEEALAKSNLKYNIIDDITGITLNYNYKEIYGFEKVQLIATVNPDIAYDKTVTYKSSDENTLTVDENGLVTAKKPGKATVTAKAANGLEATCEFDVIPYNISDSSFGKIENQTYTGSEITPDVSVSVGSNKLVKNVDYKITYLNNKYVGLATARITGIGNYDGYYDINFKIVPKKTTSFTVSSTTTSSVTLKWDKVSSSRGYAIYRYDSSSSSYKRIATINSNSTLTYTDTNLKSAYSYSYRIKPIKTINGTTYYGDYSYVKGVTKPLKPVVTLTSTSKKTATISWNKVSRVNGYKIYRASSKSGTYSLVKTISDGNTTSYKNTNLQSSKYYYYKVRAYKVVDGKTYYSDYSTVKSIKVK